jgi:hypothetical protein
MPEPSFRAAAEGMPTTQSTTFLAVTPTMRLRLATTIENLIALLDEIDGDENLEDGSDLEFDPAELGIGDHAALHEIMVGGGVSC